MSSVGRFITAQVISNLGDGLSQTAAPLLLLTITTDPLMVTSVALAQAAPWLLFTLPAGLLVDRVDRHRLMIAGQFARFIGTAPLPLLVWLGHASPAVIYLVAFFISAVETVVDTAADATMPTLVDDARLVRVNAQLNGGRTVCRVFLAPPLAALAFNALPALPFAADTISYLLSGLLLLTVPTRRTVPKRQAKERLRTALFEGFVQIARSPVLSTLFSTLGVLSVAIGGLLATLVLYVHDVLHAGGSVYSALLVVSGTGALLGAAASGRLVNRCGAGRAVLVSVLAFTVAPLLLGGWPTLLWAAVGMVLFGVGEGVWNTVTVAVRQLAAPPHVLGRVLTAGRLIGWGSSTVGPVLAGVGVQQWGVVSVMYLAAAVGGATLLFLVWRLRSVRLEMTRPAAGVGADGHDRREASP